MLSHRSILLLTALLVEAGAVSSQALSSKAGERPATSRSTPLEHSRQAAASRSSEADAGTQTPPPGFPEPDAGTVTPRPVPEGPDAGTSPEVPGADGGTGQDGGASSRTFVLAEGIQWPDELQPLATLDGSAIVAAHAAMQRLISRLPKEYAESCSWSPRAMDVIIGREGDLYFVRIDRRVDRCGRFAPGAQISFDWFELYAVSLDGKVLARFPSSP
jgi:hypothetical protein